MYEYIFPKQVDGIEHVLSKNGLSMQLMFTHGKSSLEAKALQSFLNKGLAGLLFEPSKSALPSINLHLFQKLQDRGIPMIMINARNKDYHVPYIGLDDELGGYIATKHLISKGHRNIAGIFKLDDYQGHLRYSGYMAVMQEYSLLHNENNVLWYSTENYESLFSGSQDAYILNWLKGCSAVFCYNDHVSCLLTQLFRRNGLRIPQDVSIVGYDDSDLAILNVPNLTTIHHPGYELGALAAEHLVQLIHNPDADVGFLFKPELVVRNSVIEANDGR